MTSGGIDWQREKWQSGLGSKFIHQGEKNAVKYADEVIVLSKGVQDYFKKTADHQMNMFEDFIGYTERVRIEESGTKTDVTRLISARMATEFERGLYYGKNE